MPSTADLPEGPHWFCVQSKPKSEHLAAARLRLLEGVEVFCPRVRFQRATKRGKVWFTEALFPCYLFVRFDPTEMLRAVRYAPSVTKIVAFGKDSMPTIPEAVIEAVRREVGEEDLCELGAVVEVGDEVVVTDGAMKGLQGLVTHLLSGEQRVRILLEFLGEQRLVEVEVRKIGPEGDPRGLMGRG